MISPFLPRRRDGIVRMVPEPLGDPLKTAFSALEAAVIAVNVILRLSFSAAVQNHQCLAFPGAPGTGSQFHPNHKPSLPYRVVALGRLMM